MIDQPNGTEEPDYGAWIRRAREARGLSLADVSAVIRIDENYLRALERGNIALLPEPYMRAFLKTYSGHLGLDPAEAGRRFEGFLQKQGERHELVRTAVRDAASTSSWRSPATSASSGKGSAGTPPGRVTGPWVARPARKTGDALKILGIIVLFSAVAFAGWQLMERTRSSSAPQTGPADLSAPGSADPGEGSAVASSAPDTTVQETRQAAPPEREAEPPAPRPNPVAARPQLRVEALEEVWIQAVADGDTLLSRIMTGGQTVNVSFADTIFIKMGKNRGARLFLNGVEVSDLGPAGYVLSRLVLTPDGGVLDRRLTFPPEPIPPRP